MTEPDFWNDNIAAQKTSQELNELKMKYETFNNMQELSDETELYLEMLEEDDSVQEELEETLEKLDKIMTSYEMTLLLSEPYDHNNAILEIHPGSGGTEAQDWADMLLRMYQRYGNAKGFKVETLDYQAGDEAGIKSVTLAFEGPMLMVSSNQKWVSTVWFVFHHLTLPNVVIPHLHLWKLCLNWMIPLKLKSVMMISRWIHSVQVVLVVRTSTRFQLVCV